VTEAFAWKLPIPVAELPAEGRDYELIPDAADREALARRAGVNAVPTLSANLHVAPDRRGGAAVEGVLRASVTQTCVVTLEEFDNQIEEPILMRFAPPETVTDDPDGLLDIGGDGPPDPLVNGALDLAAVVGEFLALAVDPYPRKPGAVFESPAEPSAGKDSPFAALEKLKDQPSGKKH
jgi:uncharacterized metal-binding protein YceD (DUF177 family)